MYKIHWNDALYRSQDTLQEAFKHMEQCYYCSCLSIMDCFNNGELETESLPEAFEAIEVYAVDTETGEVEQLPVARQAELQAEAKRTYSFVEDAWLK